MIDRTEINRKLAKALAYKDAGNHAEAASYAFQLLIALDMADIVHISAKNFGSVQGFEVSRPLHAIR